MSRIISIFFQDQAYYPTPGQEHLILTHDSENLLQLQKNFRIKMYPSLIAVILS